MVVALLAGTARAQQAVGPEGPPFITVEGVATGDLAPDTARLALGITVERPTASEAAADVAKAAQAVVDQIAAEGIEGKDVRTTSVTLSPVSPDESIIRTRPARPAPGFRAATDLLVTITPAERVGMVAAHLVDKGANVIDGITYASSQERKRLDDLRAEAVRDARRKAQIYVEALGLRLGRVLEITPGGEGGDQPQPMMRSTSILKAPAPQLPVRPGPLTLRATAGVRWEILQ